MKMTDLWLGHAHCIRIINVEPCYLCLSNAMGYVLTTSCFCSESTIQIHTTFKLVIGIFTNHFVCYLLFGLLEQLISFWIPL